MVEKKMVTGQGYGLGIGGCKRLCPTATGHSLVTLLSLSVLVKDRPLHKQVTYLLSRAHTWVWVLGRLVTLLSWVLALSGPTVRVVFGLGGPCTALSSRLRGGGLESQFERGPRHPGQEGSGLVLLVPWVQAGRVFSGYPTGGIDS